MQQQQRGQQTGQMWWGWAEYRCNKNNMHVIGYNDNTLDSALNLPLQKVPTQFRRNPGNQPAITRRYGFAASSILSTIQFDRWNVIKWALLDSGTTSHYIMTTAPVRKKIKAINPVTVIMPNGIQVASTHECKLGIPLLPEAARFGHTLPSLAQHSLISVVKLCSAGCEVQFRNISCEVNHYGRVIMAGIKCQRTGL